MVVDTSVLIAIFFNEDQGPWAVDRLQEHRGDLQMSTVNYAEALILIQDRQPQLLEEIRSAIETSSIRLIAPNISQAEVAASARPCFRRASSAVRPYSAIRSISVIVSPTHWQSRKAAPF
jgi:uncharacterized protein with PIN domain